MRETDFYRKQKRIPKRQINYVKYANLILHSESDDFQSVCRTLPGREAGTRRDEVLQERVHWISEVFSVRSGRDHRKV